MKGRVWNLTTLKDFVRGRIREITALKAEWEVFRLVYLLGREDEVLESVAAAMEKVSNVGIVNSFVISIKDLTRVDNCILSSDIS